MSERRKVLLTVPTSMADPWIHKLVVQSLFGIIRDKRHFVSIMFPSNTPYENNLHHIVCDFVKSDFHFWLNIDSDNPPVRNPMDLVELDRDIIGLPTPVWHCDTNMIGERPYYWNVYKKAHPEDGYREFLPQPPSGIHPVDAIGTGCFLVSRRVFLHPEMQKAPFQRQYHEDGRVYKGNDISFCERATACGFGVFAHFDYPCRHYNEIDLVEAIHMFAGIKNG